MGFAIVKSLVKANGMLKVFNLWNHKICFIPLISVTWGAWDCVMNFTLVKRYQCCLILEIAEIKWLAFYHGRAFLTFDLFNS